MDSFSGLAKAHMQWITKAFFHFCVLLIYLLQRIYAKNWSQISMKRLHLVIVIFAIKTDYTIGKSKMYIKLLFFMPLLFMYVVRISVTRLGDFLKILSTNFVKKAQIFGDFWAILKSKCWVYILGNNLRCLGYYVF